LNFPYFFIYLITTLIYLALGIYTIRLAPKSHPHRILLLICLLMISWSLPYAMIFLETEEQRVLFWYKLSSIGWCNFFSACLHLYLILTKRVKKIGKAQYLLYLPGLIFTYRVWKDTLIIKGFIRKANVWYEVGMPESIWFWLYIITLSAFIFASIYLVWRWKREATLFKEKKQAQVILLGIIISFITGVITNLVLPAYHITLLPAMAPVIILIWVFFNFYAILRYRFMSLSPHIATQDIFSRIRDIVILLDRDFRILKANERAKEIFQIDTGGVSDYPIWKILKYRPLKETMKTISTQNPKEHEIPMEIPITDRNNRILHIFLTCIRIDDEFNDTVGYLLFGRDISEKKRLQEEVTYRKKLEKRLIKEHRELEEKVHERINEYIKEREKIERSLRESEKRYRTLFEMAFEPIMLIRGDKIVDCNRATEKLFECSRDEIIGRSIFSFSPEFQPDGRRSIEKGTEHVKKALREGSQVFEWEHITKTGNKVYVEVSLNRFYLKGISYLFAILRDITERKRLEEELKAQSLRDELTGLYNRRGFFTLAEQEIKEANRSMKKIFIIFLDLDGLKEINDRFGHKEGDNALIAVSKILKQNFREPDIIARIGGDEFVVMALDIQDGIKEEVLKNRIKRGVERYVKEHSPPYNFSISIGISEYDPRNPLDIEELLSLADKKMYEEKIGKEEALE